MPLKDNEGKLSKAFKDAQTSKPEKAPPAPPSKPAPHLTPRPPGVAQSVHTNVENAKRPQVSPQLRDDAKAAEFKKKMLVKQEFNRAAKHSVRSAFNSAAKPDRDR